MTWPDHTACERVYLAGHAVRVIGCDLAGNEREFECENFASSLMQHEIDHLDGILTLHRAAPTKRRRAITELLRPDAEAIPHAA